MIILTLLSLSLRGSWGSFSDGLEGCASVTEDGRDGALGREGSALESSSVTFFFSTEDGSGAGLLVTFSDGATWATPSPDFEITATLVPGWTTSPSFATS